MINVARMNCINIYTCHVTDWYASTRMCLIAKEVLRLEEPLLTVLVIRNS